MRKFSEIGFLRHFVTLIACLGSISIAAWVILQSGRLSGHPATDWDLHVLYAWVAKTALFEYHQWPLWDPYHCGGMTLIGNPQARYLSPWFLIHLFFQTELAIKIECVVHILISLVSAYVLLRSLGLSRISSWAGSLVYALNGAMMLRISGAHFTFLSFSYSPLYFACLHHGLRDPRPRWGILAAIVLTTIGLDGLTYPLVLTILSSGIWILACAVEQKRPRHLLIWLSTIALASVFLAPKLLPTFETISGFDRSNLSKDSLPLSFLYHSFLSRTQHFSITFPADQWISWGLTSSWWGEYGAYIGIVPLVLILLGLTNLKRMPHGLPFLAAMIALLALWFGNFSSLAPWSLLRHIPPFNTQEFSSRMSHPLMLYFSVFTGLGAEALLERMRASTNINRWSWVIPTFLFLDLSLVGLAPIQEMQYFSNGELAPGKSFYQIRSSRGKTVQAANFNLGVINCYESLFPSGPRTSVIGLNEPEYKGEAWSPEREVQTALWSPNRLAYRFSDKGDRGQLVINQNFDPNWKVDSGTIVNRNGLLAVNLPINARAVELEYLPSPWLWGIGLMLLGILFCAAFYRSRRFWFLSLLMGVFMLISMVRFSAAGDFFQANRPVRYQDAHPSILFATLTAMDHALSESPRSKEYFEEILQWPGSDPTTLQGLWKSVHDAKQKGLYPLRKSHDP